MTRGWGVRGLLPRPVTAPASHLLLDLVLARNQDRRPQLQESAIESGPRHPPPQGLETPR